MKVPQEPLSRFCLHLCVFLPMIGIFVTAWVKGAAADEVLLIALFTVTSVSLEICWTCVLKRAEAKEQLVKMAQKAPARKKPEIEKRLLAETVGLNFYYAVTAVTLVGWFVIATCEVDHLLKSPLSAAMIRTAGALATICVCLSTTKLWLAISSNPVMD